MSQKWFANPGQVVQVVLAAVGVWLTAKNAYPDFKADQLFSVGTATFYVLLALFVVMAAKLFTSIGSSSPQDLIVCTVPMVSLPEVRPVSGSAEASAFGDKNSSFDSKVRHCRLNISLGDVREVNGPYHKIKIEFRDIENNTDKKPGEADHGAVLYVDTGGGLVYGGGRTKRISTNCYFVPVATITHDEETYTIMSMHYSERHLSLFVLNINHINVHTRTATLTILTAT